MGERTLRATVAYDGTDFAGWQVQADQRTVQGELQQALQRMHGHEVRTTAAGRTDAGVHATGQVVSFRSELDGVPPESFPLALNSHLPDDVRVVNVVNVPPSFDARRSALLRVYRYQLLQGPPQPHLRRHALWLRRPVRLSALNRMAAQAIGEHDFTAFASAGGVSESAVRDVLSSSFVVEHSLIVFRVAATSFLWKMVRSLVGTMLDLERSGEAVPEASMAAILSGRDRRRAGPTAPPRGLFLERVLYPGDPQLHSLAVKRPR